MRQWFCRAVNRRLLLIGLRLSSKATFGIVLKLLSVNLIIKIGD
jgi:hypothetical protein